MGSNVLDQSLSNTVQVQPKSDNLSTGYNLFTMLSRAGTIVPPWWSTARDVALRKFWKDADALSGAIFTIETKLTTIPIKIIPRDMSIKSHQKVADIYQQLLIDSSNFGGGWMEFFSQFIEDYYTQDNGAFAELIGDGPKDQAIEGPVISMAHLDSAHCTRTGNAIYPVVYSDKFGKLYKLHHTRVMFQSQQPSPVEEMYKVGFCAVSRAINAAQNLMDLALYKQEKMGSRPMRSLLVTKGGIDPDDVVQAMTVANSAMNLQGLSRFAKSVVIGNRTIPDGDIKLIDLANVYDGFDEETATVLGMALVALAFGMEARELFPVNLTGSTKADAIISHMKERGKGPGQTLQMVENLLNSKFLPSILRATFDYQDDAEDRQRADIVGVRAQSRQRDLVTGSLNVRTVREQMLWNQEITNEQFAALELEDGRLPDGVGVEVLFHSNDNDFIEMLGGNSSDDEKMIYIMKVITSSRDVNKIEKARQALAAIKHKIESEKQALLEQASQQNIPMDMQNQRGKNPTDESYQTERLGRKLGKNPATVPPNEPGNYV